MKSPLKESQGMLELALSDIGSKDIFPHIYVNSHDSPYQSLHPLIFGLTWFPQQPHNHMIPHLNKGINFWVSSYNFLQDSLLDVAYYLVESSGVVADFLSHNPWSNFVLKKGLHY